MRSPFFCLTLMRYYQPVNSNDKIYSEPRPGIDDFTFDDQVADVFSDMIERSVPGYQTTISTIGALAGHFASASFA